MHDVSSLLAGDTPASSRPARVSRFPTSPSGEPWGSRATTSKARHARKVRASQVHMPPAYLECDSIRSTSPGLTPGGGSVGRCSTGTRRERIGADEASGAQRVVVTLGTMRSYGFRSAVERLTRVLPEVLADDAEVLWQVGATDVSGLDVQPRDRVTAREMRSAIEAADLVVAHAGIGSALTVLDAGKCPVLLPRRCRRSEHVDDHQLMIAAELAGRGLAVTVDATAVTSADLRRAMGTSVNTRASARRFPLAG